MDAYATRRIRNIATTLSYLLLGALLLSGLPRCSTERRPEKPETKVLPPEELYGRLFYDVQSTKNIFRDSKTFVDCVPLSDVDEIVHKYSLLEDRSSTGISRFIDENFEAPSSGPTYKADSGTINAHITNLWGVLKRPPDVRRSGTLIPLPHQYLVPGGRFREIYYWDSYFTMLGLQTDNQIATIQDMVDNFSYLLGAYGYIPNGNRTYYLSRSQPPFFSSMITLLADSKGDTILQRYLKDMETEYAFWMNGAGKLTSTTRAIRRVVMLPGGEILNRYWDDKSSPRSESYFEDVATSNEAALRLPSRKREDVLRDLRAAAESGWDFSSRWLMPETGNAPGLYTIHTTEIIPVDLNSLLYNLEYTIESAYRLAHDTLHADVFRVKREARKKAILKYCWSGNVGYFMDFDFVKNNQTSVYSLAGVYPLYFRIADSSQAIKVADRIHASFLRAGGVTTSLSKTREQWDGPNGWAPLQWMTIQGLRNYGQTTLASEVKKRWLSAVRGTYENTYKMMEKYNVEDPSRKGGGGEYPAQDGFGWTNGVYQKLSKEPDDE